MNTSIFIGADELRETLGVSRTSAYKIIKQLNDELAAKGFLVIQGRTSRQYFSERFYGEVG